MNNEFLLLGIHGFLWAYLAYGFWRSREIEYHVKNHSWNASVGILAIGFLLWGFTKYGIFSLVSCILASIAHHLLPSGFSENAVYLNGQKISYRYIRDWLFSEERYLRVVFYGRFQVRFLFVDFSEKEHINAYRSLWSKRGHI